MGLFRKNVQNFAVNVITDVNMLVGGEMVTVQNYSTQAGGRDAVSQGVELYAQHTLDFGLGFQFNYTYNDASKAAVTLEDGTEVGKTSMPGSAKMIFGNCRCCSPSRGSGPSGASRPSGATRDGARPVWRPSRRGCSGDSTPR